MNITREQLHEVRAALGTISMAGQSITMEPVTDQTKRLITMIENNVARALKQLDEVSK